MTEQDIPLLHEWLQQPHIVEWWGSEAGRAIRCYEKAGFRRLGPIVTPDGPAEYRVRDRESARRDGSLAR